MSDEQETPPLSVLLADYEAELYTTLQQIQALPKNTVLATQVEEYITNLAKTVKLLRKLATEKWQLAAQICEESCTNHDWINTNDDRIIVTNIMLRRNLVGDIIAIGETIKPRKWHLLEDGMVVYEVRLFDQTIYVKAKHLSLPQPTVKLTKVALKDGNIAWLTKATLEKVQSMLSQKTEGNVSAVEK